MRVRNSDDTHPDGAVYLQVDQALNLDGLVVQHAAEFEAHGAQNQSLA